MTPQTVNALNLPVQNALNFPAAILRPAFYDAKAPAAVVYGSIGAVIGHEISHSFDDQGAQFDAAGKFRNWWTPEDLARFKEAGAKLVAQYSAYQPFPDLHVNGQLTLSENIADVAGCRPRMTRIAARVTGDLRELSAPASSARSEVLHQLCAVMAHEDARAASAPDRRHRRPRP